MVIKADGGGLVRACFLSSFFQGSQAAFRSLNGGQHAEKTQDPDDPHSQSQPGLKVNSQKQEEQGREDDGQTELAHPKQ